MPSSLKKGDQLCVCGWGVKFKMFKIVLLLQTYLTFKNYTCVSFFDLLFHGCVIMGVANVVIESAYFEIGI